MPMNIDEALLLADDVNPMLVSLGGVHGAAVVLARKVREQHATLVQQKASYERERRIDEETIDDLQRRLDRALKSLAASRRDADRAAQTAGRLAEQRLTTAAEAEAEERKWMSGAVGEVAHG